MAAKFFFLLSSSCVNVNLPPCCGADRHSLGGVYAERCKGGGAWEDRLRGRFTRWQIYQISWILLLFNLHVSTGWSPGDVEPPWRSRTFPDRMIRWCSSVRERWRNTKDYRERKERAGGGEREGDEGIGGF